jgi:enamine deaminase RidA (YjgF/YER057c/UK114 family)
MDLSSSSKVKTSNPAGLAPPKHPFSKVASVEGFQRLVMTAGLTGVDPEGRLPGTFAEQVRQALANLRTALASEGMGPEDILSMRQYIMTDLDLAVVNKERLGFLGDARPAACLTIVNGCTDPAVLYLVEATAAR